MKLFKLIGYDPETCIYTNPSTGQVENLPKADFMIAYVVPDADYEDYSGIITWPTYGSSLVGTQFGFKDLLSLRTLIYTMVETLVGTDYVNWDLLSSEQKKVALKWCNIRIVNAKGIVFYITECGSQDVANNYIEDYITLAIEARIIRFNAYSNYGFNYLGKTQGLLADSYARQSFMDSTYINRGVVFKSVDGIDGLGDWILGQESFTVTGLKPRIISGQFTLGGGISVTDFCNNLIGIIDSGIY